MATTIRLTRRSLFSAPVLLSGRLGKAEPLHKWTVVKLGERMSLKKPEGSPCFLLGINHTTEAVGRLGEERAENLLTELGFNSAGYDTPASLRGRMPWFAGVTLVENEHWRRNGFGFADVFDVRFQESLRSRIRRLCQAHRNDANLVGYYWTDTPRWNLVLARRHHGTNWLDFYRALPTDAPGRQRLSECRFAPDESLRLIAHELYRLASEEFRRHDPGRLIFGDRYKLHDHPASVLSEAARFVDVISIQPGPTTGPWPGQGPDESVFNVGAYEEIHRITGKPIIVCDHACSFRTAEFPVTLWHQYGEQEQAAAAIERYMRGALNRPFILGYCRCQFQGRFDRSRNLLKQGILHPSGRSYEPFTELIRQANLGIIQEFEQITKGRGN